MRCAVVDSSAALPHCVSAAATASRSRWSADSGSVSSHTSARSHPHRSCFWYSLRRMLNIKRVGVIGAGTMGNGIAQIFAQKGFEVQLVDLAAPALDRARSGIEKSLDKFVEKSKLTSADRDATLARLSTGTSIDALASTDYIVEAIVEDESTKRALFSTLDTLTRPHVILSSNTSSISITTLGAATRRPDKVLGMHFMNPVPIMSLVELIRGQATSAESMLTATNLCMQLGKTAGEARS